MAVFDWNDGCRLLNCQYHYLLTIFLILMTMTMTMTMIMIGIIIYYSNYYNTNHAFVFVFKCLSLHGIKGASGPGGPGEFAEF